MKNIVITIARQYGSGGRTVGNMLAERLGIHYYDKELMKLAAEESGISERMFVKADENVKTLSPLARIAKRVDELGGVLIICADHGNAEELLDKDGNKKTSHTTNKIPCIIYDNTDNRDKYKLVPIYEPGLSNIAATVALMLGQNDYPSTWDKPLIVL